MSSSSENEHRGNVKWRRGSGLLFIYLFLPRVPSSRLLALGNTGWRCHSHLSWHSRSLFEEASVCPWWGCSSGQDDMERNAMWQQQQQWLGVAGSCLWWWFICYRDLGTVLISKQVRFNPTAVLTCIKQPCSTIRHRNKSIHWPEHINQVNTLCQHQHLPLLDQWVIHLILFYISGMHLIDMHLPSISSFRETHLEQHMLRI